MLTFRVHFKILEMHSAACSICLINWVVNSNCLIHWLTKVFSVNGNYCQCYHKQWISITIISSTFHLHFYFHHSGRQLISHKVFMLITAFRLKLCYVSDSRPFVMSHDRCTCQRVREALLLWISDMCNSA